MVQNYNLRMSMSNNCAASFNKTDGIRPAAKYECIGALTFFWCL